VPLSSPAAVAARSRVLLLARFKLLLAPDARFAAASVPAASLEMVASTAFSALASNRSTSSAMV
jgi:hypothetical protein